MTDPIEALPWVKRSEVHWQIPQLGLDYWPTRFKWRHKKVTHLGASHFDVLKYVSALNEHGEPTGRTPADPSMPHDLKMSREAQWGYCCISGEAEIWIFGSPYNQKSREQVIRGLTIALNDYHSETNR